MLSGTGGVTPEAVAPYFDAAKVAAEVRSHVESCSYNLALQAIILNIVTPANQYLDTHAPWKLVKTGNVKDLERAKFVIYAAVQSLRMASILLKPFIPRSAETIYAAFSFGVPWADVTYADAAKVEVQAGDLRVTAELIDGKPKPLFQRIK